jgi:hypothetical protein
VKINMKDFTKSKELILNMYSRNPDRVIEFCVMSFIPLVVVYKILNTEFGLFEIELNRLVKFYSYVIVD